MSKAFRYHKDCPEGRIFDSSELEEMESQGWVDAPHKIGQKVEAKEPKTEESIVFPDDKTSVKKHRGRPKKNR